MQIDAIVAVRGYGTMRLRGGGRRLGVRCCGRENLIENVDRVW